MFSSLLEYNFLSSVGAFILYSPIHTGFVSLGLFYNMYITKPKISIYMNDIVCGTKSIWGNTRIFLLHESICRVYSHKKLKWLVLIKCYFIIILVVSLYCLCMERRIKKNWTWWFLSFWFSNKNKSFFYSYFSLD